MAKFKACSMQECYKQYNERQSYAARQWDRLDTSFETREAAIKERRALQNMKKIQLSKENVMLALLML